ncbi:hypothetical protein [Halobacillus sp. A5]|uniref:hypothetical protein n=1 Tax=Halobacillus sp. A5 TaxID=2880263 RepID=UPI0020A63EF8|nr:hypothetical protein [Halobacillus sp. A5]MCP3029610.1 hypothetical protein [Halobacillus sp. A5]
MRRSYKFFMLLLIALLTPVLIIVFLYIQDKMTVKDYAQEFYSHQLPQNTKILDKGHNFGVFYGGGPWGSGGRPTMVAYMKLSTELSEKEVLDYYNNNNLSIETQNGIEVYFNEGREKKEKEGKVWYEGKSPLYASQDVNQDNPIDLIIQVRTEFNPSMGELASLIY